MEEFLDKLYSNEYFVFYLIIAIIVLVILFLVILFFGKKDQRKREIEATIKLQQINADAFKEEQTEEKLEVIENNLNNLEDTIVLPDVEAPTLNNISDNEIPDPIIPVVELEPQEPIMEPVAEPVMPEVEIPVMETPVVEMEVPVFEKQKVLEEAPVIVEPKLEIEEEPILERIEEKPLVFEDTTKFGNDFINEVLEMPQQEEVKVEPVKTEIPEIEVPVFNFDEVIKDVEEVKNTTTYTKGPQIFSSVYVPEKKIEIEEPRIEIPVEKLAEKSAKKVETKNNDDFAFELPSLKKEETKVEKIEMPVLTDYNLDELSGETYTIK